MKTTLKKLTAFILAVGLMAASMTTVYASGYSYTETPENFSVWENDTDFSKGGYHHTVPNNGDVYIGIEPPASAKNINDLFFYMVKNPATGKYEYAEDYYWDGSKWMRDGGKYSWDERNAAIAGYAVDNEALLAALAELATAEEAGFVTVGDIYYAAEKNMSAAEYYNNVIINTPGIEEATPVGQGGKLIIDGIESGMTASFDKVERSYVDSVRTQTEGTVLNVVKIGLPLADGVAVITTNFYMPGVAAGDEITVLQYVNGAWEELAVTEIRADHVVLNLERSGVIAFVRK